MGINADYCVKETANGAIDEGFSIFTAKDLLSGMDHHSLDNSEEWYEDNSEFYVSAETLINESGVIQTQ